MNINSPELAEFETLKDDTLGVIILVYLVNPFPPNGKGVSDPRTGEMGQRPFSNGSQGILAKIDIIPV